MTVPDNFYTQFEAEEFPSDWDDTFSPRKRLLAGCSGCDCRWYDEVTFDPTDDRSRATAENILRDKHVATSPDCKEELTFVVLD